MRGNRDGGQYVSSYLTVFLYCDQKAAEQERGTKSRCVYKMTVAVAVGRWCCLVIYSFGAPVRRSQSLVVKGEEHRSRLVKAITAG